MVRRSDKESAFVPGPFVPTDPKSLARREEEINQKPLEELLSVSGYRKVDDDRQKGLAQSSSGFEALQSSSENTDLASNPKPLSNGPNSDPHELSALPTSDLSRDPTMPQNRPNSSDSPFTRCRSKLIPGSEDEAAAHVSSKEPEELPSRERLEHLITLDQRERQIQLRGGPGRLSFEEVDDLVNPSRELRGLVTSWLEWASF